MHRAIVLTAAILVLVSCVTVATVTPLHEAARDGDLPKAEREASRGADVDAKDEQGRTPLHYTAANGDTMIAEWLLSAGADPNVPDAGGNTPLHYAASNCYASIVTLLLQAGAEPGALNDTGKTAGDLAREVGCEELAALLETAAE